MELPPNERSHDPQLALRFDGEVGFLPEERPCGEDHRDGHPGYDLDEQAVYASVASRRAARAASNSASKSSSE